MTTVDDALAWAQLELGKPYVYGDEGPNTFDCSGLTQFVYGKAGVSLPRTAAQQQKVTTRVAKPQPGDLVFWGDPAYHVAIYVGGGKVIAAPKPGGRVEVENVWGSPTYGRVKGIAATAAPIIGAVTGAATTVGDTVSGWLGAARTGLLELTFAALGLGLVGYGLYRLAKPTISRGVSTWKGIVTHDR